MSLFHQDTGSLSLHLSMRLQLKTMSINLNNVAVFHSAISFLVQLPGVMGGGALPYLGYTGMCHWTGYGFLASLS